MKHNRLLFFIILALLVANSGCSWFTHYVYVHPRYPVIVEVEKPKLRKVSRIELAPLTSDVREKIRYNIKELMLYGKRQQVAISKYNEFANDKNTEDSEYAEEE